MAALRALADERGVPIVEDACQSPGAVIAGRRAGTWGDAGVLSFGGSKLTAAGRGGAIVTSDRRVYERIRRHVLRGNDLSPLSELQAAALVPQWLRLEERNAARARGVRRLLNGLGSESGLRPLQVPASDEVPGYYKVGFEYQSGRLGGLSRETFCRAMRAEGVAFSPGFRALHRIHAGRRFRSAGALPAADRADDAIVVLHHPVLLEDQSRITEIADAAAKVRRFADDLKRLPIEPVTGGEEEA
jgi:dTDP-4-amino-4,6-dideoxygalactose transaminase